MSNIPRYSPSIRVCSSDVLHDRFQLSIGPWRLSEEEHDTEDVNGGLILRHLTQYLSCPVVELRNDPSANLHSIIFRRAGLVVRGTQRLEFRERAEQLLPDLPPIPPILAAGQFNIQSNHYQQNIEIQCTANFRTNATRYMRQQRQRLTPAPRHLRPYAEIFRQEFPVEVNGERCLDQDADNWLPTNANGKVIWSQKKAICAVTELTDKLKNRITCELARAIDVVRITDPRAFPVFNYMDVLVRLRQLECYFEFFHYEPLRFVQSVATVARSYANRVRVRHYEVETNMQSLSIRMELRTGILLRVYAKTNYRVRFEIQYNLADTNIPLNGLQPFTTEAEQLHVLSGLREHAASEVNQFLEFLDEQPIHPARQHSALMLVTRICDAARNTELARDLLEQLCVNRRVVLTETSPLRDVIRRLADHHLREPVLVNRRRTPIYRLTRAWLHAINSLTEDGCFARLAGRPVRRAALSPARAARNRDNSPADEQY